MNARKSTKDSRIKKRGNIYWARFQKRGRPVDESLHTASFEVAKKLVEEIERDILLGVEWRKERDTFPEAWAEFMKDKVLGVKTKRARPKTLYEYESFFKRFYEPHFKDLMISQVDELAWHDLVSAVRKEKPGIQFDNIRKYLAGFLRWAFNKKKIRLLPELFDPDVERKENRQEAGPGKAYSLEELKVMRDKAKQLSPRFYLFMLMLQFMGMRPGEVTQLLKDRIDLKDRVLRLRKADTKTHKARRVPIHKEVLPLLVEQMNASKSPALFPNLHDESRPMDRTGFKKFWNEVIGSPELEGRVYDMRHTFITHAIMKGVNPIAVAVMTGTSLKMIEEHYLHLSAKDLATDLDKLEL